MKQLVVLIPVLLDMSRQGQSLQRAQARIQSWGVAVIHLYHQQHQTEHSTQAVQAHRLLALHQLSVHMAAKVSSIYLLNCQLALQP